MAVKYFKFLTGDKNFVDYGGKWYRLAGPGRFFVIELFNMKETCGSDAEFTYLVELSEVNLGSATPDQLRSALSGCGYNLEDDPDDLQKVEMLHSYGCSAPLGQWEGNAWAKLMKQARAEAKVLAESPEDYETAMERPVNRIGSTAREYQAGDINSAMLRGMDAGDPCAIIMAKIHGITL